MPLDAFQKHVARIIASNRFPNSQFGGGSMIQRHGFRLSFDSDIFTNDEDIASICEADMALLSAEGLRVELVKNFPGFMEAMVSSLDENSPGTTTVQWVQERLICFFSPIPDREFGFRLHFADLAVNKLLACAGRKKARDFADLWMIDRFAMPLWRLANAAPGKDDRWSPFSILERLSANMSFRETDFERDVFSMMTFKPKIAMPELMESLDLARERLRSVPDALFGKLEIRDGEAVTSDLDSIDGTGWKDPDRGGAVRTPEDGDGRLISRIVETFGIEGARITEGLEFP